MQRQNLWWTPLKYRLLKRLTEIYTQLNLVTLFNLKTTIGCMIADIYHPLDIKSNEYLSQTISQLNKNHP